MSYAASTNVIFSTMKMLTCAGVCVSADTKYSWCLVRVPFMTRAGRAIATCDISAGILPVSRDFCGPVSSGERASRAQASSRFLQSTHAVTAESHGVFSRS